MFTDPSGHSWDWSSFLQGIGYVAAGVGAVVAGTLVVASGVASAPMFAIAVVTIATGTLTTANGVSEVVEAGTNYNFVEDFVFNGNSAAYNTYATITSSVATIGSMICGGWLKRQSKVISNIGNSFETGHGVNHTQIGVDPNSLKLNTSLHPQKYKAAMQKIKKDGMYGIIEVYSNGTVYNGNHRVYIARKLGIVVDTIVVFGR